MKFHFEQTILSFWTKFTQKRYLWSKAEKLSIIIEMHVFKLVLVPNSTIIFIIFWDSLIFYQIFLSPQVKRCAIITYKHGRYELPHELPNDLGKVGNIRKRSRLHSLVPSLPTKMKLLLILGKKYQKIATKLFLKCAISHEN